MVVTKHVRLIVVMCTYVGNVYIIGANNGAAALMKPFKQPALASVSNSYSP